MQTEINILFNAIKQDDIVGFAKNIKNNENVCFGRFPLLSLCYLYDAKKIIKNFKHQILKLKYYTTIEEPYEVYVKFKALAGRNLRLYLNDNSVVSPIEMLAILRKDRQVKRLYREYISLNIMTDKIVKNISKIYLVYSQDAKVKNDRLKISTRLLTRKEKFAFRLATSLSMVFVLILSSLVVLLTSTVGLGTSFNPYKIYYKSQLISALSTSGNYILANDFTVDEPIDSDFKGTLNGNGHTLTISSLQSSILTKNNGTIKNLNIVYGDIDTTISTSASLLIKENNGTLDNISISINSLNINCKKDGDDIYISAITTNNGTITNCNVSYDANISTSGEGECFVSGICGTNIGTISECVVNGSISTTEADASGISVYNEYGATIKKSINNMTISQISDKDGWSPTIAGIVLNNEGSVENCTNTGALSVTSNNETESPSGYVILGGISANNYGKHAGCLNKGKLTALSKKIYIYCGGISAYSSYQDKNNQRIYSNLDHCGQNGEIDITLEAENGFVLAGGLCGFLYGDASNCYSLATFSQIYDGEKYRVGSAIGNASATYNIFYGQYFVDLTLSNNYVLKSDDAPYHIGSLVSGSSLIRAGSNMNSGITVATRGEIISSGVYFDA